MRSIRKLDFYRKQSSDIARSTLTGACCSVITMMVICTLLFFELIFFMNPDLIKTTVIHQDLMGMQQIEQKVSVNIDMIFHHMPCLGLSLMKMDSLGYGFDKDEILAMQMVPQRLDRHNNPIPETFTSTEVTSVYKKYTPQYKIFLTGALAEEQCRVRAHFLINKTPGKFLLSTMSTHEFFAVLQQMRPDLHKLINFHHTILSLTFGSQEDNSKILKSFGENKATDFSKASSFPTQQVSLPPSDGGLNRCQYFIKLVPHLYSQSKAASKEALRAYQYSFSGQCEKYNFWGAQQDPGISFIHDIAPFTLHYTKDTQSIFTFFVSVM